MEVNVWTDVALDPYSDQGHDGMVSNDKRGDGGRKTQTIDHKELSQPSLLTVNTLGSEPKP